MPQLVYRTGGELKQRAFTLNELLIVVAVMATLMMLIFPAVKSAMTSARRSACTSNLHQIAQFVEVYRQDHGAYPHLPGEVGPGGIPVGGVTALAQGNAPFGENTLWCEDDPFPGDLDDLGRRRDYSGSTYQFGYNYYGYVTTTDGQPFPIPTAEAAEFLYGAGNHGWDLQLITDVPGVGYRPAGLFQGLWNVRAPAETIVTFCPHHYAGWRGGLPVVTLSGTAHFIRPVRPRDEGGDSPTLSSAFPRTSPGKPLVTPIDWRIHKAPLLTGAGGNSRLFGDALGEVTATAMPLIETQYRAFTAEVLDEETDRWYNTGIAVKRGALLMFAAAGKWNYRDEEAEQRDKWDDRYQSLFNNHGELYFTPDGDPLSAAEASAWAGRLIGRLNGAGTAYTFAIGSRGSYRVPADDTNPAELFSLYLGMTDAATGATVCRGWVETWIGLYDPQ